MKPIKKKKKNFHLEGIASAKEGEMEQIYV